jgi:two-component system, sensor histidine kinase and response regulator
MPKITLVVVVLLSSIFNLYAREQNIKIGVLIYSKFERPADKWKGTAEYLTKKIPPYTFSIVALNSQEIIKEAKNGNLDFLIAPPGIYIELESTYHASNIATLRNKFNNTIYSQFGGLIFARSDNREINSIHDIAGKKFMAVSKDSFGGWLMELREFRAHGIDPFSDFASMSFSGNGLHEEVVYAVRDRVVDAGAIRSDFLERFAKTGKINLSDFKVLEVDDLHMMVDTKKYPFMLNTRLYPEWTFAKMEKAPDELSKKVELTLLQMDGSSSAAQQQGYAGWIPPMNNQSIIELQRDLKIGLYRNYGIISARTFLAKYWLHILMIGIVIFLFYLRLYILRKRLSVELLTKDRFFSIISHDLRSPFSVLLDLSKMLNMNLKKMSMDEVKDYSQRINNSAESAYKLLENLLEWSMSKTNIMEFRPEKMSVCRTISNTVSDLLPVATSKNIIIYMACTNKELSIKADPQMLITVLRNLISNGIKFTAPGGFITIRSKKLNNFLEISVADTGIGITEDEIKKVFRIDVRHSKNGTNGERGTGLGLLLCKEFIEKNKGKIWVKSVPGKGSTFGFTLPLDPF